MRVRKSNWFLNIFDFKFWFLLGLLYSAIPVFFLVKTANNIRTRSLERNVSHCHAMLERSQVYANFIYIWEAVARDSITFRVSTTRFPIDKTKKNDFRLWKYQSKRKFRERRHKPKWRTSCGVTFTVAHDNGDCSDAIDTPFTFVRATEQNASFERKCRTLYYTALRVQWCVT